MTPVLTISSRVPDRIKEPYYHYPEFLESCKRQSISPIFIPCHPYRGLMSKPKYLLQYLEKNGAAFDHVICADAWDIIFLTGVDEIMYNYSARGPNIVFNAERNCFPRPDWQSRFPSDGRMGPYRYLNSGFFVGPTDAIIKMLREMELDNIPDDTQSSEGTWICKNDQEFYQQWFLEKGFGSSVLDYGGVLCQSLHEAEENEFAFIPEKKRVVSLLTKNQPCVCHGNGGGKAWLERIIRWLNL